MSAKFPRGGSRTFFSSKSIGEMIGSLGTSTDSMGGDLDHVY